MKRVLLMLVFASAAIAQSPSPSPSSTPADEVANADATLKAASLKWSQVTPQVKAALMPTGNGFTQRQRDFFAQWWITVTPAQVTAANKLLPANTRITPIQLTDGTLVVNADLLTDAIDDRATYGLVRSALNNIVIRHVTPDLLPPPDPKK